MAVFNKRIFEFISGLFRRVVWWLDTNVSEDRVAYIFRVEVRVESESLHNWLSLSQFRLSVEPLLGLLTRF